MGFESNKDELLARKQLAKQRTLKALGLFVEGQAKLLAPVDLGNLRDSMGHRVHEANDEVVIGNSAEYAVYVEKGTGRYAEDGDGRDTPWVYVDPKTDEKIWTVGQHPQPYLRPAAEGNKPQIRAIIKNNMDI